MNKIIAIDGPAASGKGTLSRNLAKALNFAHMDTGALYRAVAYEVLQNKGAPENEEDAIRGCASLEERLRSQTDSPLDNPDLRNDETGSAASKVASLQTVRNRLLEIQRSFAATPGGDYDGAILDGRDIGTVICPNAPLKLYITAKLEIRAQRRMKELQSKGLGATYSTVLEDMRARDARDRGRETAPLKSAEDAVTIDSSDKSADEILEIALNYARKTFALSV
ncbi:MAG: (d)CMP kinase [Alphaproteobacteria bacterium]